MQAVILAGGFGTRIAEESDTRPKPMVRIGDDPLLVHLMKSYAKHGVHEFIVCLGYKGEYILDYFRPILRDAKETSGKLEGTLTKEIIGSVADLQVILFDTGLETMTGGRLRRAKELIKGPTFCFTYGDGLSDINIAEELQFHKKHSLKATVAAVRPPGRFAVLEIGTDSLVTRFSEKPEDEMGWINGGFFVLEKEVIDLVEDDSTVWETGPLEALVAAGELAAYYHRGFWQPVDSLRDLRSLQSLWHAGLAKW